MNGLISFSRGWNQPSFGFEIKEKREVNYRTTKEKKQTHVQVNKFRGVF